MLILVKLQAETCRFTKIDTPPQVFFTCLNCANATKLRNASQRGMKMSHGKIYNLLEIKLEIDMKILSSNEHIESARKTRIDRDL